MQNYSKIFSIERMAEVFQVSRSAYYSYLKPKSSCQTLLLAEIKAIFARSKQTYGSPRIHAELRSKGYNINKKKVARLMHLHNIKALTKACFRTRAKKLDCHIAPNLLDGNFSCNRPNQKWASDISYIRTSNSWTYLAVIIDLFSKSVIGMAYDKHMRTELVLRALTSAISTRGVAAGLILHSDQGSQYTSIEFQKYLKLYGIRCSMSSKGRCYDNAPVESFFGTLKTELDWNGRFESYEKAKIKLFEYIYCWYNNNRRHSSLGYLSPREFESRYQNCSYIAV